MLDSASVAPVGAAERTRENCGFIGVNEMAKSSIVLITKASFLLLLVAALCLVPGCKKAEDTPEVSTPQTPTDVNMPSNAPNEPNVAVSPAEAEAPAEPEVAMTAIEIDLPTPMFVGTPQENRVENLRKPRPAGEKRPPFLAPEGTQLLSRGKPVTGDNEMTIYGDYSLVTDGDKEASDGSYIEMLPSPPVRYITIDLQQQSEIYAIVVWHYHKQPRVYYDVIAQVSPDPDFVTDVTTVFNNDTDNSAGQGVGKDMHYIETYEGELIDCLSQGSPKARYVRLYSSGNNIDEINNYIEVEVYGKPVE